ncbi:diacylglycerol kinase family protein [Nitrosomonas sp. Nm33]|uniref:diacylglycerol/lipid kinase family protein n=1 Tax=Nitrosomonas sp. Nm33 TaxID=133724 RepID=UPI00089CC422|nr:diacylglycerol kinase family protein [Nitrosomonas sp. Nm33]SDX92982.1 diacylglycerol kinase (ATP) [Nitrosomonas sp. Nm33]
MINIPSPQKVLIIFNPISSAGNTESLAHEYGEFLANHGIAVEVSESKKKMKSYKLLETDITGHDLLVVIGGDGTVRKLLPLLSKTDTPVYMVPGGNESLFARSYGMSANTEDLLQAITNGRCLEQFYGLISGNGIQGEKPFFIMASMGFDSLTVKQIGKRIGPINDSTYVRCGFNALVSLHHPTVTAYIDGQTVIDRKSGYVIVANSSAYARNLQLVPTANPSVKKLVLGFLPGAKHQHELIKALRMLQHKPAGLPLQYFSGESISLTLHDPSYPLQVDGDYFRNRDIEAGSTIKFSISQKPIRVLI